MAKLFLPITLSLVAMTVFTGCIDDKYDLSDIDSTIAVPVNDLVIPVNIGPVTLENVIDTDDNTKSIKSEPYQGNDPALQDKEIYVYTCPGSFNSKEIKINKFVVTAPRLEPTKVHVDLSAPKLAPSATAGISELSYDISSTPKHFEYDIKSPDDGVVSVKDVKTPGLVFQLTLNLPTLVKNETESLDLNNIVVKFPEGLLATDGKAATVKINGVTQTESQAVYDPNNGELLIKQASYRASELPLVLSVTANEVKIGDDKGLTLNDKGEFQYEGDIVVDSGVFTLHPNKVAHNLPQAFDFDLSYSLNNFEITHFTGEINYLIKNLTFEDAMLNDIPKFLSQENTDIILANPQIYLDIYNTCSEYDLEGITGLELTPVRDGVAGTPLVMNENIKVGYNKGEGPYKFAISPEGQNLYLIDGYKDATKVLFSDLGNILKGNGLPGSIKIEFPQPHVMGTAENFPLGVNIPAINGNYKFRSPLALAKGSKIVYYNTEDKWDSEALQDLKVENLEITANVNSTIPLDVTFSVQLLNQEGEHIGKCEPVSVPADAQNYAISIKVTPDDNEKYISDIDGIYYEVTAISQADAQNPANVPDLRPDQSLILDNIKAKVKGIYEHIDDDKN